MIPIFLKPYDSGFSNLIRIGRNSDGGYVIDKRVINQTNAIISCGLEAEWSFEKEFKRFNKNCKIISFDHTVNTKFWIDRIFNDFKSLFLLRKIYFNKFYLFRFIDYLNFFNKNNLHYLKKIVSKKKDKNKEITITEAIGKYKNVVLKIDIEGDEFKILKDVDKNFNNINLVIIEFHDLQKNLNKIKNFIKKTKFRNIHINANNYGMVDINGIPQVIEMTLINPKKFKIRNIKVKRNYPLKGLDFKNRKRGPNIKVVFSK